MFTKETYIARRLQLKKDLAGNGLILLLGNEESSMNYKDNLYPFRQDRTFLYFFGLDRPALCAVIDPDSGNEILFGDDFTLEEMVWTGYQEPLSVQGERSGITLVKGNDALEGVLKTALQQDRPIHYLPVYRPEQAIRLGSLLNIPPASVAMQASVQLIKAVVAQRSIKSKQEILEIEKAVNLTADLQMLAMQSAREGMSEAAVAGGLEGLAISAGGSLAFPTILTVNGQILHNHYSPALLKKGDMVLCDCGAQTAMHYGGDLTRTFPVNASFSPLQRELYEIVLRAHEGAVSRLAPAASFRDIHLHACELLVEGLQGLGIMRGNAREAVSMGAHALFFPCGLGHMLGLDTHDMENLGEQYVGYTEELVKSTQFGLKSLRLGRKLEPGFVLTVEPGLYFIPELIAAWAAEKKCLDFINYEKLKSFTAVGGFRVEEDFLITTDGYRLLGKPLAKQSAEMEAIRVNALG